MLRSLAVRASLAVMAALAAPAVLSAQAGTPSAPSPAQPELDAMLLEFQQIHMQLEDIQGRALADPQLHATQVEIGNDIRAAMEAQDPTMPDRLARMGTLETEAQAAQQSGDETRLEALVMEAHGIEEHLLNLQQRVMQEPAMAARIAEFQTQLERKMDEVDPETPTLIARFRQLESRLAAATVGGGA